jgi:hypothetical protein
MKYAVAQNWEYHEFVDQCETYLKDGWEPIGGICITVDTTAVFPPKFLFSQAFAKRETVEVQSEACSCAVN